MIHYAGLADLKPLVGLSLGSSEWFEVEQKHIDAFAAATGDEQWIHIDPVRAARGPFGGTIAHGFLTLSLLPALLASTFAVDNLRMGINYGLNKVRFPAVVPAGSRLRGHVNLLDYDNIDDGVQVILEVSVEREGHAKPVCVAQLIARWFE